MLSIWVVTAALVYLAAARIISNDYEIEARAMLATSACAVGVNLVYVPWGWAPAVPAHLSPAPPMSLEPQEPQLCRRVTLCPCAPALCPWVLPPPLPCRPYARMPTSPHSTSPSPQAEPCHEPQDQTSALFLHTFQPCCTSSPTPPTVPRPSLSLPVPPLPKQGQQGPRALSVWH